jgi:hypothetical protein
MYYLYHRASDGHRRSDQSEPPLTAAPSKNVTTAYLTPSVVSNEPSGQPVLQCPVFKRAKTNRPSHSSCEVRFATPQDQLYALHE